MSAAPPDTAALRAAPLPPRALADLFEAMWRTLERMPSRVRALPSHGAALAALGRVEEPIHALLSDLEDGLADPPAVAGPGAGERLAARGAMERYLDAEGYPGLRR